MVSSLLRWSHNEREAWGLSISLRYLMQRANWWPVEVNSEEWRNIPNMEIVKPSQRPFWYLHSWTKIVGTLVHNSGFFPLLDIQFPSSPTHLSMLCCCEHAEQTASRITGLSNLNQPRAAHLSVRPQGGPHKAKSGEFYRFSKEFWLYMTHHISNYSGLMEPKIVIQYFLVSLFH